MVSPVSKPPSAPRPVEGLPVGFPGDATRRDPADDDAGPDSEVAAATAATAATTTATTTATTSTTTDAGAADVPDSNSKAAADDADAGAEEVLAADVDPNALLESLTEFDFDNLVEDANGLLVPGPAGQSAPARSASAMSVGKPLPDERATATPSTTARKEPPKKNGEKKKNGPKIRKNCRVKVKKKHLIRSIKADEHKAAFDLVSKFPRGDRNFFGKVIGKANGSLWSIEFDELPLDSKKFPIARTNIKVLAAQETEKEFDREEEEMIEKCAGNKPSRRSIEKECVQEFLSLSLEEQKSAKSYAQKFGPGEGEAIQWTILADNEQIVTDAMGEEAANKSPFKVDIPWDPDVNKVDYNETFFKFFFPSLAGKAKLLDKWLSDPRCPRYDTAKNDKIVFHREDDEDPDKLIRLCITLMIVGSLKVQNGVENLWKRGPSEGFEPHANFGQFIPANYFECFVAGFPFLWCDEKYWYTDPKLLPWEVVLPFFDECNSKRNTLLAVIYLLLDESMSGWRPKTSKAGGLPNISYEPRKPVDLGTMIRDAAECKSGVMAFLDIVQDVVNQRRKKYTDEKSHLPKGEKVYVHVAETLRQAEGAGLERGGWLCGDAFFGTTVQHETPYVSKFEDEFGHTNTKDLARPSIAHMMYEYLPLIDEHNKARQNVLALEKTWPTKFGFFRVLTTAIGMCVVDLQRWDRHKRHGPNTSVSDEFADNFDIKRMANLIGKALLSYLTYKNTAAPQPTQRGSVPADSFARITDKFGSIHRPKKNVNDRLRAVQLNCYICRQYSDKQQNTQWKCAKCGMPLHNTDQGREQTCLEEHLQSCNPFLGCNLMTRSSWSLPNELRKFSAADDQCLSATRTASLPREATPSPPKRSAKRKRGDNASGGVRKTRRSGDVRTTRSRRGK
mmetsp:Transcript_9413/g.20280  ORF Transcript_9413/g.20280 Transcript_9413/m.20280 type:complete len:903 (+) Transcript_9413:61-2769(+)